MKEIPYKHIYGKITVSVDELRRLNPGKGLFAEQLKDILSAQSQFMSDVEKERKRLEVKLVKP